MMSPGGYDVFNDPYCYQGTFVLKNRAGLRDAKRLERFELEMTTLRAEEPLPNGRFGPAHFRAVHRHLFQDVYAWAGRYRTVRTAKSGNAFCYPEYIAREMERLFRQLRTQPFMGGNASTTFIEVASEFLAELNAIHAFREGNGRAQLAFLYLLSIRAGCPLDMSRIRPVPLLRAMIQSFNGDVGLLRRELKRLRAG